MDVKEKIEMERLSVQLMECGRKLSDAIRVLDAAAAAEKLLAQVRLLVPSAAPAGVVSQRPPSAAAGGRVAAIVGVREFGSVSGRVGGSRVGAVFDHDPQRRAKVVKMSAEEALVPF